MKRGLKGTALFSGIRRLHGFCGRYLPRIVFLEEGRGLYKPPEWVFPLEQVPKNCHFDNIFQATQASTYPSRGKGGGPRERKRGPTRGGLPRWEGRYPLFRFQPFRGPYLCKNGHFEVTDELGRHLKGFFLLKMALRPPKKGKVGIPIPSNIAHLNISRGEGSTTRE